MQLRRCARGFTLTELAVVFAIITLLIGGAMATFSVQVDLRNEAETRRRLDAAVEALIGYAIVNRRLPCPAIASSTGSEAPSGGGTCTLDSAQNKIKGYLPAQTIGFQPTNPSGYGIDAWGNPIRYAVAKTVTGCTTNTTPHFTTANAMQANGVSCRPTGIIVCVTSTGTTLPDSCGTATSVATTETVAFVVFSTGKNGGNTLEYGTDETANTTESSYNGIFIYRTPGAFYEAVGAYDDLMVWVPAGVLYYRLISAGVLP